MITTQQNRSRQTAIVINEIRQVFAKLTESRSEIS